MCLLRGTDWVFIVRLFLESTELVTENKVEFSSTLSVLFMNTNSVTQNDVYSNFPQSLHDTVPDLVTTVSFHICSTSLLS
jgi:hypothetical protein